MTIAASMRPGRFHPGNHVGRLEAHIVDVASMRPGRFHPGNWSQVDLPVPRGPSFNEAGAFPPRKSSVQ